MCELNRDKAEAFAAVIAIGFLARNTMSTLLCKETEVNDYNKLFNMLGIKINLDTRENVSKPGNPAIVGLPKIMGKLSAEISISDNFIHEIQKLEQYINTEMDTEMYDKFECVGAYVGAVCSADKISLFGPSALKCVNSKYRKIEKDQEDIKKSYEKAKAVSDFIVRKLKQLPSTFRNIKVDPSADLSEAEDYKDKMVFKSVHGMIRAITGAPQICSKKESYIELALGKDTMKIASCIPCAIYMTAVDQSASYVHLGRGDNWNFPSIPEKKIHGYDKWKECIADYYNCGIQVLDKAKVKTKLTDVLNKEKPIIKDNLEKVFLESLTYEGDFYSKIKKLVG